MDLTPTECPEDTEESSNPRSETLDPPAIATSPSSLLITRPTSVISVQRMQFQQPRLLNSRSLGSSLLQPLLDKIDEQCRRAAEEESEELDEPVLKRSKVGRGQQSQNHDHEFLERNNGRKGSRSTKITSQDQDFENSGGQVGSESDFDLDPAGRIQESKGETKISQVYNVLHAKPTTKKHKTWDGDGTLTILEGGKEVTLRDEDGQILSSAYNFKFPDGFGEGSQIQVGGKLVEIQDEVVKVKPITVNKSVCKQNIQKGGNQRPQAVVAPQATFKNLRFEYSDSDTTRKQLDPERGRVHQAKEDQSLLKTLEPERDDEEAEATNNIKSTTQYNVLHAKPTTKKHKTWDGDGTLTVLEGGKELILRDEDGQILSSAYNFKFPDGFGEGSQIQIGGKLVEIQDEVVKPKPVTVAKFACNLNIKKVGNQQQQAQATFKDLTFDDSDTTKKQRDPEPDRAKKDHTSLEVEPEPNDEETEATNIKSTIQYSVLFAKATTKKHKTWDGDGTLTIIDNGRKIILQDDSYQYVSSAANFKLPEGFGEGSQIQIGGKLVEVQDKGTKSDSTSKMSISSSYQSNPFRLPNPTNPNPIPKFMKSKEEIEAAKPKTFVYSVLYAQPTTEKHNAWEGDGTLTIVENGKEITLRDESTQVISTVYDFKLPADFDEGAQLEIGEKVVEVSRLLNSY